MLKKKFVIGAHQIFAKSWMDGNVGTCVFVSNVLRDRQFEMADLPQVKALSDTRYIIPRDVKNRMDASRMLIQTLATTTNLSVLATPSLRVSKVAYFMMS